MTAASEGHTREPWTVDVDAREHNIRWAVAIRDSEGQPVAWTPATRPGFERAEILARAPALLAENAALRAALTRIEQCATSALRGEEPISPAVYESQDSFKRNMGHVCSMAREAIKAALLAKEGAQ